MAGLNILTLGSGKTYTNMVALGISNMRTSGSTVYFTVAATGEEVSVTLPAPADGQDGISVTGISDKGNGVFTLLLSDGSESDPIQTVKGEKGDKGDKLTFNDLSDIEKASLKGEPGFSPTITENENNTDKIYKLDITTADTTFTTPNLKGADGQGGSGGSGEENVIESIKVNGVAQTVAADKSVDITVPDAYDDTDIRAELANKANIDHTHTTVNGHTVESDVPVDAKFTDTVYDDTQVKTAIQAVANGLMDSVGYSADYKTIDIIAKNGVKKSVNVAPIISHASITELSDVDTTNKATGKALVYNATTSKHEYEDVSGTDEKVKMDASTDAKYLGELLDNITIANENGELKVKKLDGQEVTITEINYLKGLTMNVMDLVNMFSNGGVKIINTPVATYAELLTLDKSSFIEGISYLVYVLADENHDNAKTTYLVDKDSATPTYFGFADSQRDFVTNPIDLATEITGKLGIANMDSDAIKALFMVDDTYKTETATNNAFSTHGAKALYDELLLAIGGKANDSDLTAHKDDTDIHVSTEDRTKWDSAKTHADSAHAPSTAQENVIETVKVNNQEITPDENKAVNIDLTGYAEHDEIVGENLIPYPYADGMSKTMNGIEYTVNPDGSVTAVGTAIETSAFVLAKSLSIDPNTTYILSGDLDDEITYKSSSILFNAETSSGTSYWNYGKDKPVIFTGISVMANFRIRISKDETVNQTFYPMLEVGNIAHKYQPYKLSKNNLREDIDNLQKLEGKLENQFNTTSGDFITVTDSVDGNIVELGVKGNSFQQTYSGYNLLPYPFYHTSKTVGNITVTDNKNGSITINGDNGDTSINIFDYVYRNHTFEAGTYHVSGVGRGWIGAYTVGTTSNPLYSSQIYDGELTFTVDTDFDLLLRSTCEPNGSYNNVTYYPMLVKVADDGTYPTEYEPYVGGSPSPSPSYPQEINSVGDDGSLVVKSCRKNLIPYPYDDGMSLVSNGITFTVNDDGSITANGTATKESAFNLINPFSRATRKKVKLGQRYILIDGLEDRTKAYIQFVRYDSSKKKFNWILNTSLGNKIWTENSANLVEYGIRLIVRNGATVDNVVFKPMLVEVSEDGTYPTEYEPYNGSATTIPLSEPLRAIGDIKDEITYQDGKWGVLRRTDSYIFDGSSDEDWSSTSTTVSGKYRFVVKDNNIPNYADLGYSANWQKDCLLCSHLSPCLASVDQPYNAGQTIGLGTNETQHLFQLYIEDMSTATVDEFREFLSNSPMHVIVRRATPTFEPFADQTLPYLSTYDGVTNISNDDALSAEMTVKYPTTDASGVGSRNESRIAELAKDTDESLSVIGKCKNLLNPTLQTTTKNGITCTANGDGTYTVSGTNSTSENITFIFSIPHNGKGKGKLVGCPQTSDVMLQTYYNGSWGYSNTWDKGNGSVLDKMELLTSLSILVYPGKTVNITFKPMLTTNLNATYDDFVPYTGDGDTLTEDVAELKNDLSVKKFELVAGVLWLCVCGKHCVLTLNGYNLTEPTHFDKLEEYQPYLVARNVVSNGNSVCIAAVEPNGNINASDLVVGTSLTGQLFGEVSWIANI